MVKDDLLVITGGCGFIGANLVRALNQRGYTNLMIVDHLDRSEKWKNLRGVAFEDYLDRADFLALVKSDSLPQLAGVFHLGACSSTVELDSSYLMENNYRYTRTLAQYCIKHGTRFITASSAATYGDGQLGYSDHDEATIKYQPLNMYGMSKHLFDLWALRHNLYKQIVGLKFFNVYGPYEAHKGEMKSVVWKAFHQVQESGKISLFRSNTPRYQDGEQKRDFVYVGDAVKIMLYFYDHPEVSGLFNCGTGIARTWNALARAVFKALDKPEQIEYIPMPEYLRAKYQCFTQADLGKLRSSGYQEEFTSLEAGVEQYVRSYLLKEQ